MGRHGGQLNRRAFVVGTGGHARVILSILRDAAQHDVVGLVELGTVLPGESIMGLPVCGVADAIMELTADAAVDVFLAIGDNSTRRAWWERLMAKGMCLPNLVSPYAVVDPTAMLGSANVVCARAFVGPEAVLGDDNLVNTGAILEHEARIGSHCHFAPASTVSGRSTVGDGCFLGAGSTVIDRIGVASETIVGAGATIVRTIEEPGNTHVGTPGRLIARNASVPVTPVA